MILVRKDWPGRWTQVAASTQAPSDPDLAALADLRERTAKAVEDAAHDDAAVEFAAVVRGVPLLAPVVPTPIPALPSVWDSPPPASPEGPRQWERLVSVAEPGYAAIELHECVHTRPWGPVDYAWRLHSRRLVEWPPKRSA